MSHIFVILWIISVVPLLLLPYSIALFYRRIFKRNTYPLLFLASLILYIASSIQYLYSSLYMGGLFFAIGGVLLGGASYRLHHVMTKRWR